MRLKEKTWKILANDVPLHVMDMPQMKRDEDITKWASEIEKYGVAILIDLDKKEKALSHIKEKGLSFVDIVEYDIKLEPYRNLFC